MDAQCQAPFAAAVCDANFRALFDSVAEALAIVDPATGAFIDVNRSGFQIFGYPYEEARQQNLKSLSAGIPPYTIDEASRRMEKCVREGPQTFDWLCRRRDGTLFWTNIVARAAAFNDRPAIFVAARDISEHKRIEQSLSLSNTVLATIIENSLDAILVVGADNRIVHANRRFAEMWRIPQALLDARDDEPVLQTVVAQMADPAGFLARIRWLYAHPDETEREELQTKDGRVIDRYSGTLRAAPAEFLGRIWFFRDITKRKLAEATLVARDRVLHAVTLATTELVTGEELDTDMASALKAVGDALAVERVVVVEGGPDPLRPPVLRYDWQKGGLAVRLDQAFLSSFTPEQLSAHKDWLAPLREGKPVIAHASTSQGEVRALLGRLNTKSILLMPIGSGGAPWGAIALEECHAEREWLASEIDALQTFSEVIGAVLARNRADLLLQKSEARFRAVSETAQDAIILVNDAGKVVYWNRSAERTLGYARDEVTGNNVLNRLVPVRYQRLVAGGLRRLSESGRGEILGRPLELSAVRKDGTEIPVEISVAAVQLDGERHGVVILRDITERKQADAEIARLAREDNLTGLPNRGVFVDALKHAIARSRRSGARFAVLYLDLDHFKDVNDTLGHPAGDELLKQVAIRLHAAVRDTDTVARFGGDEFAVIATDIHDPADAALLADKLLASVSETYAIAGMHFRAVTSIGITVCGGDSPDAEAVLSQADLALYRAKNDGRGTFRFFTESMDREVRSQFTVGQELRDGITAGELFLVYQPQVDAPTGEIVGVEALVRWRHPQRGVVMPDEFVPVAEKTGLIISLGRWVIHEACRQMKEWLDAGIAPPLMAVNVSSLQFRAVLGLEDEIYRTLQQTSLPPQMLELELTETALMETSREHNDMLMRLHDKGVRIAVDDFGTGYSSLAYLSRFPIDRIKVSQTFTRDMLENPRSAEIVNAAIGLAHAIKLKAVAEGVENTAQLKLIAAKDCRQVQGYLFSRPLLPADLLPMLRAGRIDVSIARAA